MPEIGLSLININAYNLASQVLKDFDKQSGTRLHLQSLAWSSAWSDLVKYAIYKNGPDVSEVGSTWVGDLMKMNALHPFTKAEIEALGGEKIFFPASWEHVKVEGGSDVWAIPFLADSRLLYYRRDSLEKAGVDESTAFVSPEAMKATLQRLKDCGVEIPWTIPTHKTRMIIQNAASWIWGAGGDFLDASGKKPVFDQPQALKGLSQYFDLAQFLNPGSFSLDENQSDALFYTGKAAVCLSGPWLLRNNPNVLPEVIEKTGVTLPPGVPFVGGSSLVFWQFSRKQREALALIKFLTSEHVQRAYLFDAGLLPVRTDVLASPPFSTDPKFRALSQGLQSGRSFRLLPLWGLVEDRITTTLSLIWKKVLAHEETDLYGMLERDLTTMARQLELVLNGE